MESIVIEYNTVVTDNMKIMCLTEIERYREWQEKL